MTKYIIFTVAIIATLFAGERYLSANDNPVYAGKSVSASKGIVKIIVASSGTVEPGFEVELKSKASGKILKFPFEPGDNVIKGEELIRLDPRTEERNVAQKEADLTSAEADLQSANADLIEKKSQNKRADSLKKKNIYSEQDYETSRANLVRAQAAVKRATAALKKAEVALDDARERLEETVILSPIDGVILKKSVQRGQIISSGISSVTGGTELCVVADLSEIFVIAMVDETDIGKVAPGQIAAISVDAYPGKLFNGKVIRIFPMGELSNNITVFKVKIDAFDKDRALLKPQMTANVDILVEESGESVIVPGEAVLSEWKGSEEIFHTWVEKGGKPVKRSVTPGLSNGFETIIESGVTPGEKVYISLPGK